MAASLGSRGQCCTAEGPTARVRGRLFISVVCAPAGRCRTSRRPGLSAEVGGPPL